MKLIKDWSTAYRFFSMQAMTVAAAVQGAWLTLSPEMIASLPPNTLHYVTIVLMVAGAIGRLIPQKAPE